MAEEVAKGVLGIQPRVRVLNLLAIHGCPGLVWVLRQDHVAQVVVGEAVDAEQVIGFLGDHRPRQVPFHQRFLGGQLHIGPLERRIEHVGLEALVDEVFASRRKHRPGVDVLHVIGSVLARCPTSQCPCRFYRETISKTCGADDVLVGVLSRRIEAPSTEPLRGRFGPLAEVIAGAVIPGDRLFQIGPLVKLIEDWRRGELPGDHRLEIVSSDRVARQADGLEIGWEALPHVPPGDLVRMRILPFPEPLGVGSHVVPDVKVVALVRGKRLALVRIAVGLDRLPAVGRGIVPCDLPAFAHGVQPEVRVVGPKPRRAE